MDIQHSDGSKFTHPLPDSQTVEKVQELKAALENEVCKDGAWVEDKGLALTFHYRNVPREKHQEMITKAEEKIKDAGFVVGVAHCAIECKPKVNIKLRNKYMWHFSEKFYEIWVLKIRF